jgi:flavin reductase (DIM6/NTAB) family NADH-FMN oxidoreductase RutF
MTKMGLSIHQQLRLVLSILSVFLATVSMASSFKTPIPSPPPVSVPVYSLTTSTTGSSTSAAPESSSSSTSSMNIVTFATPVSINPKLYMISLYHGTKTKDTFFQSKHGILQLLDKRQKDLVPLLGKRSGYDYEEGQGYDKEKECDGAGFP